MIDDPNVLDYLLQIGALEPQQQAIKRKQTTVEQLRAQGATPGMRSFGRVTQAAHPLEFVAALGNQYMANRRQGEVDQLQDQYGQDRRALLERLVNKRGAPPAAPGTPAPPSDTQGALGPIPSLEVPQGGGALMGGGAPTPNATRVAAAPKQAGMRDTLKKLLAQSSGAAPTDPYASA